MAKETLSRFSDDICALPNNLSVTHRVFAEVPKEWPHRFGRFIRLLRTSSFFRHPAIAVQRDNHDLQLHTQPDPFQQVP